MSEDYVSQAYLIWIGSEFYPSIASYNEEAVVQGISKRIPSVHIGRKLMEPGAVVFVAHDEGKTKPCKACAGYYECPDCRKRVGEMAEWRADILRMHNRYSEFPGELFEANAPKAARQFVTLREMKIEKSEKDMKSCPTCKGKGRLHGGTGGNVTLLNDQVWDYRKFNYHLHQPKKFDAEKMVVLKEMCEKCGGTGELPQAQIFGLFIPEKLEYIMTGEETEEELAAIPDAEKVSKTAVAKEKKRLCGKRKPGGFYVTTHAGLTTVTPALKKTLKELERRGLVSKGGADVTGSFIRFLKPLAVNEKRFRGIKSLELRKLSPAVKSAARDIVEARA